MGVILTINFFAIYSRRVFHSIRFKVNKGGDTAVSLFYFVNLRGSRYVFVCVLFPGCESLVLSGNGDEMMSFINKHKNYA